MTQSRYCTCADSNCHRKAGNISRAAATAAPAALLNELRLAHESLAQIQDPDAGYFADPDNRQPHEAAALDRDIQSACDHINRLENKLKDYS